MSKFWCGLVGSFLIPFSLWIVEAGDFANRDQIPYFENLPSVKAAEVPQGIKPEIDLEVSAVLPDYPWVYVKQYRGYDKEKCLSCHQGIEEISHSHPLDFGCTVCHGGRGDSVKKEEAHSTLIYASNPSGRKGNPSHLKSVSQSCGQMFCHEGHDREDRNLVTRVKKSIMGTLAGVISGLRYQWAGQADRGAKYGVYSVFDRDGWIPRTWGALSSLEALPFLTPQSKNPRNTRVSHHIGDDLLQKRCFRCHLDFAGSVEHRGTGCAACHMTYSQKGRYEGSDPTLQSIPGSHSRLHQITALPPNKTCAKCHRLFENFKEKNKNLVETTTAESKLLLFPGRGKPVWDVHMKRGFDCVDCHTAEDIMGDGNLYSKQHQAVEIRCESCHGEPDSFPRVGQVTNSLDPVIRRGRYYSGFYNAIGDWMAISQKKRKLSNVKVVGNSIVTFSKRTGRQWVTPLIKNTQVHNFPGHKETLECASCHSQWVPHCGGCHITLNQSESLESDFKGWSSFQFSVIFKEPVLMVGPKKKVAPMLAQAPKLLSLLDEEGKPVPVLDASGDKRGKYLERPFVNVHGYSGTNLAYAINPHSISRDVLSCADCHMNIRTLGLGEGALTLSGGSIENPDEWEALVRNQTSMNSANAFDWAKVTPRGEPIAGTSQEGARPFNQREITRILRVGNCIPCHDHYDDPIYQNMEKSYQFEKTVDHRKLRLRVLNFK